MAENNLVSAKPFIIMFDYALMIVDGYCQPQYFYRYIAKQIYNFVGDDQ
ncbi:MAG: hypothetical protein JWP45_1498 [Mucilaginibacter sp.]|nr:hypothetical protein [Mucilaginibacter sp.]MDB5138775.1 hypothetical protein [Mucilaginibacter sp.]